MTSQYWSCIIGPIEQSKIPYGGDFPLRMAVKEAYIEMFGKYGSIDNNPLCSSGWGMDEEEKEEIKRVRYKHFCKRNGIKNGNTT
jgi:hypothetical protein